MPSTCQRGGAPFLTVLLAAAAACAVAADGKFQDADGLLIEAPQAPDPGPDFFNADNRIYLPGREFTYSYSARKGGQELFVRTSAVGDTDTKNWTLVGRGDADELTIRYVGFRVLEGYGGLDDLFPGYNQTVVQQKYMNADMALLFDGSTGLVENAANVWLHPFRGKYFSVTQLGPFPFFKREVGPNRTWSWKLDEIDDRWSDPRIVEFSGALSATYEYRVAGTKSVRFNGEDLPCTVVNAIATSRIGISRLSSCFNDKYGFIELKYRNVDGSTIDFSLQQVRTAARAEASHVRRQQIEARQ